MSENVLLAFSGRTGCRPQAFTPEKCHVGPGIHLFLEVAPFKCFGRHGPFLIRNGGQNQAVDRRTATKWRDLSHSKHAVQKIDLEA